MLLFDYDGTLTAIKPRPGLARLNKDTKLLLKGFSKKKKFLVGVISGRALADVKRKVGLTGIAYVGNHGFEIEYNGKYFVYPLPEKTRQVLNRLHRQLSRLFAPSQGVLVEDKLLSLSLHYRRVKPERMGAVKKIIKRLEAEYKQSPLVKFAYGKKVVEIRPRLSPDKGKAIGWLVKRLKTKQPLLIFAGDDITDEDAFKLVNTRKGISILVGKKHNSRAHYYVNNPGQLKDFLKRLEGHVRA